MSVVERMKRGVCFVWCLAVMASAPGFATAVDPNQDLYLEALRLISENRQDEAKLTLMKLIEKEPQHAGAWLDLAIIQCELGNKVEADRLFRVMIERFSPPTPILEIIQKQQAQGCRGHRQEKHLSLLLERGYESNANQGASNSTYSIGSGATQIDLQILPEFLPKADRFTTLSVGGTHDLNLYGVSAFAQFRARKYDSLSTLDTMAIAMGVERPWRVGNWGVRATGLLGLLTRGDHLYQKQGFAQLNVIPAVPLPKNMQLSIAGSVTKVDYPTLTNFNSTMWELKSVLSYGTDRLLAQTSVGYVTDRADAAKLGGDRKGALANINFRGHLTNELGLELGWNKQIWQSESAYFAPIITQVRRQNTETYKANLIWPVREGHTLQLEFRTTKNKENISILQYNNKSVQLNWQWQNF